MGRLALVDRAGAGRFRILEKCSRVHALSTRGGTVEPSKADRIGAGRKHASMARQKTRTTNRRKAPARARPRRKKPFVLRWYHLLIACIASFCLGYLFAFGHATRYVSTVAGLR